MREELWMGIAGLLLEMGLGLVLLGLRQGVNQNPSRDEEKDLGFKFFRCEDLKIS